MTAALESFTHPVWCSPAHCTGNPEAITATGYAKGYNISDAGAHRSEPVQLEQVADAIGAFASPLNQSLVTVHLLRMVAPWQCTTYLTITAHTESGVTEWFSLPASAASELVSMLAGVLAVAGAEVTA